MDRFQLNTKGEEKKTAAEILIKGTNLCVYILEKGEEMIEEKLIEVLRLKLWLCFHGFFYFNYGLQDTNLRARIAILTLH